MGMIPDDLKHRKLTGMEKAVSGCLVICALAALGGLCYGVSFLLK
jgi:hypothetical protein